MSRKGRGQRSVRAQIRANTRNVEGGLRCIGMPGRVAWLTDSPEPWRHNYIVKLWRLCAAGVLTADLMKRVGQVRTDHEGTCAAVRRPPGYCDCDPDIRVPADPAAN